MFEGMGPQVRPVRLTGAAQALNSSVQCCIAFASARGACCSAGEALAADMLARNVLRCARQVARSGKRIGCSIVRQHDQQQQVVVQDVLDYVDSVRQTEKDKRSSAMDEYDGMSPEEINAAAAANATM